MSVEYLEVEDLTVDEFRSYMVWLLRYQGR